MSEGNDGDVFKIMIATDNHLGYNEKDPVRGDDSFLAFEEILQHANEHQVDFLLLGGDLFHDNKPSRSCLSRTIALLRKYCLGETRCKYEIVSDQSQNFHGEFTANFQDPNYNIALPIFSVHGNHDDPSGIGALSTLDILSNCGLINYFGNQKQRTPDALELDPILLTKGTSKLALYGLGNVRDERLHRMWLQNKVTFSRPSRTPDDWFNVFVIHQNRCKHGETNYIPQEYLPDFLDFTLWGHEHECLLLPPANPDEPFYISQPGSSVATSLSEGESKPKHVGIFKVKNGMFELSQIRLKTVRPFIMRDVTLADQMEVHPQDTDGLDRFLADKVESLLAEVSDQYRQINEMAPDADVPLPLIRLRVDYGGGYPDSVYHPQVFGHQFAGRVANPFEILNFFKRRVFTKTVKPDARKNETAAPALDDVDLGQANDLIAEYLDGQDLSMYPELELGEYVRQFVEKDNKDGLTGFVDDALEKTRKTLSLTKTTIDVHDMIKEIIVIKEASTREYCDLTGKKPGAKRVVIPTDDFDDHAAKTTKRTTTEFPAAKNKTRSAFNSDEDDDMDTEPVAKKKAPARKAAPARAARGKKQAVEVEETDESNAEEEQEDINSEDDKPPARPPAKRKATSSRAAPAAKKPAASRAKAKPKALVVEDWPDRR